MVTYGRFLENKMNLTATQVRHRFGKCVESFWKQKGLRELSIGGVAMRQKDPAVAQIQLESAIFYLRHAEAVTARHKEAV
jgi:hypothetical protein